MLNKTLIFNENNLINFDFKSYCYRDLMQLHMLPQFETQYYIIVLDL